MSYFNYTCFYNYEYVVDHKDQLHKLILIFQNMIIKHNRLRNSVFSKNIADSISHGYLKKNNYFIKLNTVKLLHSKYLHVKLGQIMSNNPSRTYSSYMLECTHCQFR